MGFNKKTSTKKEKAIALRLQGKSYGQILKELDLTSKGTLSYWFKNITLPPQAAKRLESNIQKATKRGLLEFNKNRSKRITGENRDARESGTKLIGRLTKRDLLLIGAALYWGEGAKTYNKGRYPALDFANSDPEMIIIYMRFLREVLEVPEDKIRAGIHLYAGTDVEKTKEFWAQVTGLPEDRFFIVKQVSRASKGKRKWNRLSHGTVTIRTNNRKLFYKVIGFIEGMSEPF